MTDKLPLHIFSRLVSVFTPLMTNDERTEVVCMGIYDDDVMDQIDFSGPPKIFTIRLVNFLIKKYPDKLLTLVEQTLEHFGNSNNQSELCKLIADIKAYLNFQPPTPPDGGILVLLLDKSHFQDMSPDAIRSYVQAQLNGGGDLRIIGHLQRLNRDLIMTSGICVDPGRYIAVLYTPPTPLTDLKAYFNLTSLLNSLKVDWITIQSSLNDFSLRENNRDLSDYSIHAIHQEDIEYRDPYFSYIGDQKSRLGVIRIKDHSSYLSTLHDNVLN